MKLLIDENLSHKLAGKRVDLFPQMDHVRDFELTHSLDSAIWEFAKQSGFTILTTDIDYFDMVTAFGPPPKVIWLRSWAHSTRTAEALIRREAIRITAFLDDDTQGILVLSTQGALPPPISR